MPGDFLLSPPFLPALCASYSGYSESTIEKYFSEDILLSCLCYESAQNNVPDSLFADNESCGAFTGSGRMLFYVV